MVSKVARGRPYLAPKVIFAAAFVTIFAYFTAQHTKLADLATHCINIVVCIVLLGVFDKVISRFLTVAPWKLLHAVSNFVISFFCIPDLIIIMENPIESCQGKSSSIPVYIIVALHVYHLLAFRTTAEDWFHHILFVGALGPVGLLQEVGPVQNLLAFFICGLPGGLDYLLLVLVKHGTVDRLTEKKWNARINVWMRSPGCFSCAAVIFMICRYDTDSVCERHKLLGIVIALLAAVNGQHYMQVVVGNTFRRDQSYSS